MSTTIEEYADSLKQASLQELITEQAKIRAELDAIKEIKSGLEKKHDLLRLNLVPSKMDEKDTTNITIETPIGKFRTTLQGDLYFSIPASSREETYEWLRENGHGDLIKETVNASSGKAWAKECMKQGIALPEDKFKVTPFTRAQLTKVK